jgi:hypothetical protein
MLHFLLAAAVLAPFVVGRSDPVAIYVFTTGALLWWATERR